MKNTNLDSYFNISQYSLKKEEKLRFFTPFLNKIHQHHYINSEEYKKLTQTIFNNIQQINTPEDLPFLPISLFKQYNLKSIQDKDVIKVISSSGTSGSVPSRVYLDTTTSQLQTKALSKIITHIIGQERLPMLIIDSKSVLKDRTSFSARGAGILGLSVFGKKHFYLLDEDFNIKIQEFLSFLKENDGKQILIFGFTFMVWQFLYLAEYNYKIDLKNAVLIHSGGWKRMQEVAVNNELFKIRMKEKFNLEKIYNFYGMAEQVGSIFLENSDGFLQCPNYSDVIIRNPADFSVQENGKEGLVQVVSILPYSYPGHSILTEDIGVCMGEDNSSNGWFGKYFKILGRAKKAEIRGCSDTFSK